LFSASTNTGSKYGSKSSSKGTPKSTPREPVRRSRELSSPNRGSEVSPWSSSVRKREWERDPAPLQNERYPVGSMYEEKRSYNEPYLRNDGRGAADVSPWSRPTTQTDEMYKLEALMRKAAAENSSSFAAARQVERMGLGSAFGSMDTMDSRVCCVSHNT
ncbi:hypothetical protein COOONC_18496, partial [Cooperia oncophora]